MTFDQFFEKFELFADAPDAVAKMRGLVLDFAVSGRLIPQNAADGSSQDLLKRIRGIKESLISNRSIKRQVTEPIGAEDTPFLIPDSWEWTRLGDIGDWGSGSTPQRGNHEFYGGTIPWLKSGELNDNQALKGDVWRNDREGCHSFRARSHQPSSLWLHPI